MLPNLKTLNLQDNCFSIQGIRDLALFLESFRKQNVEHVYIHQTGLIEALGVVGPDKTPVTILTVDISANFKEVFPLEQQSVTSLDGKADRRTKKKHQKLPKIPKSS
mmetsp:Transcript_28537/g.33740  ORF Transcript_28537/g.33740 Transcript_28537/m.33740 type:complete len:107 (+) Transcript_28537:2-322(+)